MRISAEPTAAAARLGCVTPAFAVVASVLKSADGQNSEIQYQRATEREERKRETQMKILELYSSTQNNSGHSKPYSRGY